MKGQTTQSKLIETGILLLLSAIFVLLCCEASSPLTDRNPNDSAMFIAMGKMSVEGKVPYVDYFDHKGPSLILLQTIPQFFAKDRLAIFFMEIVNLLITLFIVVRIADILNFSTIKKTTLVVLFLFFVSRIISGNTVEEMSFVPLILSVYYLVKYYFVTKKITALDAFILGMCFSFILWLRANNTGFIIGITVFMFAVTIINKDYKSLKNLILFFIIGQLPFTLIYLAYFLYHNAVYELIYSTFLFNLNYVNKLFYVNKYSILINISVFVLILFSSILYYRKVDKDYKIFILAFITYATSALIINMGYGFTYYNLLYAPTFLFGCVLLLMSINKPTILKIVFIASTLLLIVFVARKGYYMITEAELYREKEKKDIENFYTLFNKIPEQERDKVFYYDQNATLFYLDGVTSNYKYCFIQEWHGKHDSNIFKEINETMHQNTPHYVFIKPFEGDTIDQTKYFNQNFFLFLKENYHIIGQDKERVLMQLNRLQ